MQLLAIMIAFPWLALIPAALFGFLYYKSRKKSVGITALVWLLYAGYETLNLLRITCSGECNIRVDLLLIYPVLIFLTLLSLYKTIRKS